MVGPLTVGALRDVTGGWSVQLGLLLGVLALQLAAGLLAARPRHVQDEAAGTVGAIRRPTRRSRTAPHARQPR